MTGRSVDADGHDWPDTGHVCSVCGWPLDPVHAEVGIHPGCDRLPGGGDDHLRDAVRLVRAQLGAEPIQDGAA